MAEFDDRRWSIVQKQSYENARKVLGLADFGTVARDSQDFRRLTGRLADAISSGLSPSERTPIVAAVIDEINAIMRASKLENEAGYRDNLNGAKEFLEQRFSTNETRLKVEIPTSFESASSILDEALAEANQKTKQLQAGKDGLAAEIAAADSRIIHLSEMLETKERELAQRLKLLEGKVNTVSNDLEAAKQEVLETARLSSSVNFWDDQVLNHETQVEVRRKQVFRAFGAM